MAATAQPVRRGFSRYAPAMIIVLFLAPMVAAWVAFHYFPEQMRALGTNNFGTFIHPPKAVPLEGLKTPEGETLSAEFFKDNWTYLYFARSDCDQLCQASLYEMRQVRLAQGAEMDRVQRLVVLTDPGSLAEFQTLAQREFPHQQTAVADADAQARLAQSLTLDDGASPLQARRIYVIDPLGRAMMYYAPLSSAEKSDVLAKATGMRKDMAKLLKNSKTQ